MHLEAFVKVRMLFKKQPFLVLAAFFLLCVLFLIYLYYFSRPIRSFYSQKNERQHESVFRQKKDLLAGLYDRNSWRGAKPIESTQASLMEQERIEQELQESTDRIKPYVIDSDGGFGEGDPKSAKLILFGIDGATWNVLTPLLELGVLPNFKRLLRRASYGKMDTDVGLSPISWTSIATGKRKEKTMSSKVEGYPWQLHSKAIKSKRLWDILANPEGQGLAIVDYWFIPTVEEYPRATLFESRNREHPFLHYPGEQTDFPEDFFKKMESLDVALTILEKGRFNLFATIISETDLLQHELLLAFFLKYLPEFGRLRPVDGSGASEYLKKADQLVDHYRRLDSAVGRLLDRFSEDYIVIVSDHGFHFGPPKVDIDYSHAFFENLNVTLGKQIKNIQQGKMELDGMKYRFSVREKSWFFDFLEDEKTNVPIYLKINAKEYLIRPMKKESKEVANRLLPCLNKMFDECGGPDGSGVKLALQGDTIAMVASQKVIVDALSFQDKQTQSCIKFNRFFNFHGPDTPGIIIVSGPGIAKGRVLKKTVLFDVMPTMLYMKGMPVGEDMDGKVIEEMIDPKLLASRPMTRIPSYDDETFKASRENKTRKMNYEYLQRLKAIGYIQ